MSGPIWLQRPSASVPWGFRLKGGRDFQEPLTVQRVTTGSIASTGLSTGDVIMRIGETDTASLTNSQSQELVKSCGNLLQLYVRKTGGDEPSGQQQQHQVGTSDTQGTLHELFDDIFKESDAMFSSLEAEQQKQQARANAGAYSPSYAAAGRPRPVEVVHGGPCNGFSPSPYRPQNRVQNDPASPSEGTGFPTRLARQLSELSTNSFCSPPPSNPATPQQQSGPPDFGSYYGSRSTPTRRTPVQSPDVMPDAVLNMAAKGGPEKKPWSYVPNNDMLQEQRNRVRRKPASGAVLPHYQNMLGMFDDSPAPNSRPSPVTSPTKPSAEPTYPPGPGDAVVAHVQYNTPIGLYSDNNVMEAFEGQTGGLVTGVDGLPVKPKSDITQSAVYKMIHGVEEPSKPRHRVPPPGGPAADHFNTDETSTPATPIPITITRVDGQQAELSAQEQTAIASERRRRRRQRTSGLQDGHSSTNAAPSNNVDCPSYDSQPSQPQSGYYEQPSQRVVNVPVTSERGRTRTRQPPQQATVPTNRSYGAGSPAQRYGAAPTTHTSRAAPSVRSAYEPAWDTGHAPQIKTVRSVEAATPAKSCREAPSIPTFDEDAYLSGRITIVSGSVNNPRQYKERFTRIDEPYNKDISDQENAKSKEPFDEDAYLSGHVPIFGDNPSPRPRNAKTAYREKAPWERERDSTVEDYDEDKFIRRRPSIDTSERAPWLRDENERNNFDESAFLGHRSGSREASCDSVPWQKDEEVDGGRDFNEDAFLGRQSSRDSSRASSRDRAPWVRDEEEEERRMENYDENAFLRRKAQREKKVELAPWQRDESEDDMMKRYFTSDLPNGKSPNKKRIERERAPWERDHANDDTEREFDENAFLGRSNSQAENDQSDGDEEVAPVRTMHVLRRSESREKTPDDAWDSGSEGGDDGTIKNLVYVGRKIPSKTFQRLQKVMDRRASVDMQNDPRLDVDVAVDKIDIGTHEPDKYLDLLRKSVEEQMGVEVAVENDDTTDF